jgi:lysophospholipase L1-like esterase
LRKHKEIRWDYLANQRWINTPSIDVAVNGYVDRYRSLYLRPIEPIDWIHSWYRIEQPERSNEMYAGVLSRPNLEDMEAGAKDLEQTIQGLIERGWRIAIVRMPIAPTLREVEDKSRAAPIYDRLVQDLNLPFKDFGAWPNSTWDGSHLHMEGAARATHELADWVHEIWPDL